MKCNNTFLYANIVCEFVTNICAPKFTLQYNNYLKPDTAFSRLLLPAPDGPIIADRCPFLNTPLTPFSSFLYWASLTVCVYTKYFHSVTEYHNFRECGGLTETGAQLDSVHDILEFDVFRHTAAGISLIQRSKLYVRGSSGSCSRRD